MFLTEDNKIYLNNLIKNIFINLNNIEFDQLIYIYYQLIEYIYLKLLINETDKEKFFNQLKRNNNRELKAILNLLLPYIDDSDNYKNYKYIKKLKDITTLKIDEKYIISNFQYSRGYLQEDNKDEFKIYEFSIKDIEINFELLKQTIDRLRIKFYINWVNIVPILLENYPSSKIYQNSRKYYIEKNEEYKETSLPFGEIFDTIVNDLYYNTLEFKWLLFEKNVNNKDIMYLDILNRIYDVHNILNNKINSKWILLDENKQNLFTKNMDLFFNKAINGENYDEYSNELLKDFFTYMMNFFDTKYEFLKDAIQDSNNTYKKIIKYEVNDNEINEDFDFKDKEMTDYFNNYKALNKFYLYDFIRSQILKLERSWYGFKIFRNNKIIKLHEYTQIIYDDKSNNKIDLNKLEQFYNNNVIEELYDNKQIYLSYKNIYNFGKSLFYINKSNKKLDKNIDNFKDLIISRFHDNLNEFQKKNLNNIFKDFFDNSDKKELDKNFIFTNSINKKYQFNDVNILKNINIQFIDFIFGKILGIVFECLCKRGILNEYIIRDEKFEKSVLNDPKNILKKEAENIFFKHLEKYKNAYYYLTDDKFNNLIKINDKKTGKNKTYFKRLAEDMAWYNYYAMDWVSQINFYHHYINQRITMLTGGTGVGKSSQVPKLLLYGLKAFDKKFDGKVICTQPRISPTTDNAKNISKEMGVDIEDNNRIYNKQVKTTNGIIQYKYEKDSHIDEDQNYFLRICTDGSLLIELQKSPLLKKLIIGSRDEFDIDNIKLYSHKNLYDIIIVDESHEHNSNMDLILSITRGSIFLNNQLRLYIVSATMESDDPIYRKYFRGVNDNLKYPIRDFYNPETNTFNELLDRIVIDRRIHISPPGQSTQYKINEIYHDIDLEESKSYDLALSITKDICLNNSPINNDILLFCTTKTKIIKLVDELNKVLPLNTIAIPFYRDLPEESKSLITSNVNQIKKTFKFERKYINDVLNNKIKKEDKNSSYNYDRLVIVSTNIAEASITIDSLKYVIDTGYNLDVSYNYKSETSNIEVKKISEASRLQRKGRVGRVADGYVYYTYPKNARLNIQPSYNICKIDFSNNFLSLMDENPILIKEEDIYNSAYYRFFFLDISKENIDHIKDLIDFIDDFKNIIKKEKQDYLKLHIRFIISQYLTISMLDKKQIYSDNLYNIEFINEESYSYICPFTTTGINSYVLIDDNLSFYLIHPFENDILKYRNNYTRELDKKYYGEKDQFNKNFKEKMIGKLKINLYVYEYMNRINKIRTVLYLESLKQKTDKLLELEYFYPIIMSYKLNVFENVLFIVSFLQEGNFDILSYVDNLELFKKIFSDKTSDLLIINKIFDLFRTTYKHILLNNNITDVKNNSYSIFKNNLYNYINKNYNLLNSYDYDILIKFLLMNTNEEKIRDELLKNNKPKLIPQYILNEINLWCKMYGINYEKFLKLIYKYIEKYVQYKNILENPKYNKYLFDFKIDDELTIDKNIIKSFMFGNINKIFINDNGVYKKANNFISEFTFKKNSFKKKWISNVINNYYILVLNTENEIKDKNIIIKNDEETDNDNVIINNVSAIDNKLLFEFNYFQDNPSNNLYIQMNNINHNYICNNPINIDKLKHPQDPKFNEYINSLQIDIQNYINKNC